MYQIKIISGNEDNSYQKLENDVNNWFRNNLDIKLIKLKRVGSIATIVYSTERPKKIPPVLPGTSALKRIVDNKCCKCGYKPTHYEFKYCPLCGSDI